MDFQGWNSKMFACSVPNRCLQHESSCKMVKAASFGKQNKSPPLNFDNDVQKAKRFWIPYVNISGKQ